MVKNKIKPTSVRISEDLLEGIDLECQDRSCSRNDFVIEALEEKLEGKSEEQEPKEEPKPTLKRINIDGPVNDDVILRKSDDKPAIGTIKTTNSSKYELKSIQDNGVQLWTEIEESKIPTITFKPEPTLKKLPEPSTLRYIDGQWRPYATRYEV